MNKIFIAGHKGLVGSACVRAFGADKQYTVLTAEKNNLDLRSAQDVAAFFEKNTPNTVILAAAKVGGIKANSDYPVEFLLDNLKIQNAVLEACATYGVERVIFLGSSCIYPKNCPQPIKESYLLNGPLEPTNRAYALAKITGIELCRSYNIEYGKKFLALMPTNLYGIGDNYHPQNSHVLPALIRKFHEAKKNKLPSVVIWGTGSPLREFMLSDDVAGVIKNIVELPEKTYMSLITQEAGPIVNVGSGHECSIRELAVLIQKIVGYTGALEFDTRYPDGTPRKLLDLHVLQSLDLHKPTALEQGIAIAYQDFCKQQATQAA